MHAVRGASIASLLLAVTAVGASPAFAAQPAHHVHLSSTAAV